VDSGGADLNVSYVEFWWSNDYALNWASNQLTWNDATSAYDGCFAMTLDMAVASYFADAVYHTRIDPVVPQELSISSAVRMPDGFVPHIRAVDTCQYP